LNKYIIILFSILIGACASKFSNEELSAAKTVGIINGMPERPNFNIYAVSDELKSFSKIPDDGFYERINEVTRNRLSKRGLDVKVITLDQVSEVDLALEFRYGTMYEYPGAGYGVTQEAFFKEGKGVKIFTTLRIFPYVDGSPKSVGSHAERSSGYVLDSPMKTWDHLSDRDKSHINNTLNGYIDAAVIEALQKLGL